MTINSEPLIINYEDEVKIRVDSYLSKLDSLDISRSLIGRLIEDGEILVNDKQVKMSYKLKNKDQIIINIPEPQKLEILPENIPLRIVYEDDDLMIINKQANLIVHPTSNIQSGTLVNALLHYFKDRPESLSNINNVERPGIVHRLDKDTTGLMIICKNNFSHNKIAADLKAKDITRAYKCLVLDNIKEDKGSISKAIARDFYDRKKMSVSSDIRYAKFAKTNWQVLERYIDQHEKKFCLVRCQLDTGRTHQIRVHMQYFKHPLIGDPTYGPRKSTLKAERPLLHSYYLKLVHPRNGKELEFEIDLPSDFLSVLERLKNCV